MKPNQTTAEKQRLEDARGKNVPWKKWGPYLSERQWGTVREDYSESGDAWNYFTHDQARSRAYRISGERKVGGSIGVLESPVTPDGYLEGVNHSKKEVSVMAAFGPTLTLRILMAVFLILALNFVTEIARADQKPPITIDQMMAHLSFDKSHKEALLDGKILSTGMPEMEQLRHELGVAAVMLVVKVPMKKVVAAYLDGESFRQNSDMIEYKMIRSTRKSSPAEEENFKPIGFTEEESSEVKKLLNFKGGETFNFSPDEIKQFLVINPKDSAVRDKVSLLLRRILVERYRSYFIQGLEAVKPYDRGGGKRSYPRRELTAAVGSTKLLESHFPDFYQSLLKYPEEVDKSIANEFYWFKNKMDNRPAFQLSHYMADIRSHYGIVAELQFYVEHTYNSMLTTIGCVPYEGGTVVFCANRTFTDQVAGFGSSLKRPVGRRRVEDAISEHFAKLRSVLESH